MSLEKNTIITHDRGKILSQHIREKMKQKKAAQCSPQDPDVIILDKVDCNTLAAEPSRPANSEEIKKIILKSFR